MGRESASGELEMQLASHWQVLPVAVSASLLVLKGRACKFNEVGIMMVAVTAGRRTVGAGHSSSPPGLLPVVL